MLYKLLCITSILLVSLDNTKSITVSKHGGKEGKAIQKRVRFQNQIATQQMQLVPISDSQGLNPQVTVANILAPINLLLIRNEANFEYLNKLVLMLRLIFRKPNFYMLKM